MKHIIVAIEFASGAPWPEDQGRFLRSFDFDAHDGLGEGEFTSDPAAAKQFASTEAALNFWRTTSKTRPKRADGRPNRPLTCMTVRIEPAEYLDNPGKVKP